MLNYATVTLMRYAVQPYTFSDGTYIPAGTFLAAPSVPHHRDEDSYANASHMDPLRFELRKEEDIARRHFTTTDFEYIPFGHGMLHDSITWP
jgi:cytochrome P450